MGPSNANAEERVFIGRTLAARDAQTQGEREPHGARVRPKAYPPNDDTYFVENR